MNPLLQKNGWKVSQPGDELLKSMMDIIFLIPSFKDVKAARLFLVDEETKTLVLRCHCSIPEVSLQLCTRIPFGKCVCGIAALKQTVLRATDVKDRPMHGCDTITPFCGICVPILNGTKTVGLINLCLKEQSHFVDDAGLMKEIAKLIAMAIAYMKSEEEAFKMQQALADAKRLSNIGLLAASVAHELRNPLGVMRVAIHNLNRKIQDHSVDKHVKHINDKITESSRIIDNLLFYSHIRHSRDEEVKIADILNDCVTVTREMFNRQSVTVVANYEDVRNVRFMMDPVHVREIFNNILGNAFQAVDGRGGRIEIDGCVEDDTIAKFVIRDDGVGIDQADIDRVFDPFFTLKAKGVGLGMAICKELVQLHGGSISIESDKENHAGTAVIVRLPYKYRASSVEKTPKKIIDSSCVRE